MPIEQPQRGFIFWPVGTGDSTTIRINETSYLQIDLRHMSKSEDGDDPSWPIIDELIPLLPTLDQSPYLSCFALTHPDQDHCQGFAELNDNVIISELWMSPRTFREYQSNETLCDDAEAFYNEAMRRVKATIAAGGDPGQGHRIRIIGFDHWLQEPEFEGFPEHLLSIPGNAITIIDGQDLRGEFSAFVHAPFLSDSFGDRNDCSLAFQITIHNGGGCCQALLMGDLKYPIIKRIFEVSEADHLSWNILLAPHHCSKSVFYWKNEDEDEETFKNDMLQYIANNALPTKYVISSSKPIPKTNDPGDNPPHAKAKDTYLRLGPNQFICTQEHPNEESPVPVVFEVTSDGLNFLGDNLSTDSLENAVKAAGGAGTVPTSAVGFGCGVK